MDRKWIGEQFRGSLEYKAAVKRGSSLDQNHHELCSHCKSSERGEGREEGREVEERDKKRGEEERERGERERRRKKRRGGGCSKLAPSLPPLHGGIQVIITSDRLFPDLTAELRRITTLFKHLQSKEEYQTCMEEHLSREKTQ